MDLDTLRQRLTGELYVPGEEGWDEGRTLFNAMIDKRPAAIARPADVGDVAACIEWARRSGTELAVRAGGHSVAGASLNEGGLVIDMRGFDTIEVDPAARTARAGAG